LRYQKYSTKPPKLLKNQWGNSNDDDEQTEEEEEEEAKETLTTPFLMAIGGRVGGNVGGRLGKVVVASSSKQFSIDDG
jgi:hypothetical protein